MSQALVIPCYNEKNRLCIESVRELLQSHPELSIILVNDGSTDGTCALIDDLAKSSARIMTFHLAKNSGKGEAVRQGLLKSIEMGSSWTGYADADFATPAHELARLMKLAPQTGKSVVMASRVRLLGNDIQRRTKRHYLGRIFATFASISLKLPVYDTQCGAKFFRTSPELKSALTPPFRSCWAFDVELLARLKIAFGTGANGQFQEIPLTVWRDVHGSKLKMTSMLKAGIDLMAIAIQLRRNPEFKFSNKPESALPTKPQSLS